MSASDVVWVIVAMVGVLASTVSAVVYHRNTEGRWRRTRAGRHIMGLTVALGVALTLVAASRAWGPLGPKVWIPMLVVVDVFLIQRLVMLVRRPDSPSASYDGPERRADTIH